MLEWEPWSVQTLNPADKQPSLLSPGWCAGLLEQATRYCHFEAVARGLKGIKTDLENTSKLEAI